MLSITFYLNYDFKDIDENFCYDVDKPDNVLTLLLWGQLIIYVTTLKLSAGVIDYYCRLFYFSAGVTTTYLPPTPAVDITLFSCQQRGNRRY